MHVISAQMDFEDLKIWRINQEKNKKQETKITWNFKSDTLWSFTWQNFCEEICAKVKLSQ